MMPNRNNVIDIKQLRANCAQCQVHELCLPMGLSESEVGELEQVIERRQVLKAGERLFHQGQPFRHLYMVRSGAVKTLVVDADGEERITGFHLPGELLGLDAIADECHTCMAQALETSSVCHVPFTDLEGLARLLPSLQHHLLRLMSREIQRDQQALVLLGTATAEQRLAAFLLNISCRYRQQGLSPHLFHLSMARRDMANYLGLALETVSRAMSRFQQLGVISSAGREVTINDGAALRALAFANHHNPLASAGGRREE